jgi:F-type H+-transporting ATPase subunit b
MEVILPAKTMIYEVVVSLVSFLVLFGVLAKFAFPPITKMLDKRSDTIRESLEASEATRIEAERLLEEYKTQMTEARQEAAKVIEQGRKIAETMKNEIMAKANEDAQALLVKAREGIEAEKKAAIAELQGSVADLSVAVAGKLIGETLSAADHAKLIERYVAEVGALNEN